MSTHSYHHQSRWAELHPLLNAATPRDTAPGLACGVFRGVMAGIASWSVIVVGWVAVHG